MTVPKSRIEAVWQKVHENISTHGWHLTGVMGEASSPEFTYSVGAYDKALPELIITGLPMRVAASLLNGLLESARNGLELKEGVAYEGIANAPLRLRALSAEQTRDHMRMTWSYYAKGRPDSTVTDPFLAFQVVYPDPNGVFPGEEGYQFPMQELLWEPKGPAPIIKKMGRS